MSTGRGHSRTEVSQVRYWLSEAVVEVADSTQSVPGHFTTSSRVVPAMSLLPVLHMIGNWTEWVWEHCKYGERALYGIVLNTYSL